MVPKATTGILNRRVKAGTKNLSPSGGRLVAFTKGFLLALLVAVVAGGAALAQQDNGTAAPPAVTVPDTIRVGLTYGVPTVTVSGPQGLTILDLFTAKLVGTVPAGTSEVISAATGQLTVGDLGSTPGPVLIQPAVEGAPVALGNRMYRGTLEVQLAADGTLTCINTLPLEQYLYGVVPAEMPANWPLAALEAQAVAARTYAVYTAASSRFGSLGFDISAGQESQVYGGLAVENPNSSQAVDATRGQIMLYNGQPILAAFHAASGGHTENSENVWGSYVPYLRGVVDYDQDSPYNNWVVTVPVDQADQTLQAANLDIGQLIGVQSLATGVSGRQVTLRLDGTNGSVTVKGETFRQLFHLRSTLFNVEELDPSISPVVMTLPAGGVAAMAATGPGQLDLGGALAVDATGLLYRVAGNNAVSIQSLPGRLQISGRGWGHGLGLSQWGARGMALQGYDYRAILTHYYTGVSIQGPQG